ncbi:MAG: pilus assembly protein PilM, partial [Lentisphaeria bacterium]|nr:pilus assembly protein PilM [Lentisphaeria bacterium]
MQQKLQRQALGLDIGQTGVKLVCLERRGRRVVMTRREVFNAREEGILDVEELYHSVGRWLKDLKLHERRMCLGMPQYLATTQVSDFAAGIKPDELEKMVGYETTQLAGLSEETFLSDYQVMPPAYGRQNPVLIGVCRESTVEEYADRATEEGIRLSDVAMSGLAVANTFFHLHPEERGVQEPQLLVDIGNENASILVVASGQVLYVGSLMFGAQRFSQVMAHTLGCSEQEADKLKRTLQQDWTDPNCPLLLATRQLETELRTAIDHWRAGEQEALAGELIHKIWLCGGGSLLPGLTDHLTRTYGCPVELFGPAAASGDGVDPTLAVAYGLALQGLGDGAYCISLAPTLLRWQRRKEARFPYLVGATALLFGALIAGMVVFDWWLRRDSERIAGLMGELNK